ncbi:MAG: phasin family protein [Ectothiorhodospiraceae bacterium]|jgi:poly(hydroxyalkanoate) granule-associated protein
MTESKKSGDPLAEAGVVQYARQIWLAGLGAYARAAEEGGKLFEALVAEGESAEARSRKLVEEQAGHMQRMVVAPWSEWMERSTELWSQMGRNLEDRMQKTLGGAGVATAQDVERLSQQVEALSKAVESLSGAKKGGSGRAA